MEKKYQKTTDQRVGAPKEFEAVFSHFYSSKNASDKDISKTLLPNFQIIMVFSFGSSVSFGTNHQGQISIEKCMVLGPIKQALTYKLPVGSEIFVAHFKDDAFYRFFGKIIISDQFPVHPDNLVSDNCFTNLWQLMNGTLSSNRVALLLDFCRPYLKDIEAEFQKFIDFTNENSAVSPIKSIARDTHKSERTIQINHKKYLGYSAKEKGRYQRFIKVLQLLQNTPAKPNWHDIIGICSYYDQSQLIHDFKHFTGLTPNQYLKFQQAICRG